MAETFTFEEAAPETFSFEDAAKPDLSKVKPSPYEEYKLAVAHGATPENYSEIQGLPPSQNPDYDIIRQGGYAGLPLSIAGKTAGKVAELAGDTAVKIADIPTRISNIGKTPDSPGYVPTLEERTSGGRNIIEFPDAPSMKGQGTIPEVAEGITDLAAHTANSLLGRPQSALTLPLMGGEGAVGKLAALTFGTSAAAGVPDEVANAFRVANDPNATTAQKVEAAGSPLVQAYLAKTMLQHAASTKGVPDASRVASPEGVSLPEVRQQVGQEAPLQQQGQAAAARPSEAPQGQIPLSDEHAKLLAPHMTDEGHAFTKLDEGRVMLANHETGKVEVDPAQFSKWVDSDLKGMSPKEKTAAVKSAFDHEDIHLKTDPEDAEPFWNSMSPFEQFTLKRQYLKGQDPARFTPAQFGFEAIRNRIERAMGMTRSDFVGLALRERWTGQALDHLAHIVGKIRSLKDSELNTHQKSILDKVRDNIEAAQNAIGAGAGAGAANEPFMVRKEDEPAEGMVRLYRGHDGGEGGAYWTKDKTYASRMGAKMEYLDVPAGQVGDYAVRKVEGSGTPNAFKLPPEMTEGAKPLESEGIPVHDLDAKADDLLKNKPGDTTVEEVLNLSDAETRKFFEGNQKRGNATQHDAVLAGMKLGVDRIPELTRLRDEMHKEAMRKMQAGIDSGKMEMPAEFGKVIWLNGALEGAARKGPNYESVTSARRGGPSMLRKKGKAGEQEEMFGAITQRGVPGGEDVQPVSAGQAGAVELPTEQKVFAKDITFSPKDYGAGSLPVRPITATEAKSAAELSKFLTKDARKEGGDLPVSMSKRLTVLFDKTDGSVHLVSTYRGDNVARMVDPERAGMERNSRPVDELLHRYQPVASVLLNEPRQGFHQKFQSMADFQEKFGNEAAEMMREHSTGTEGVPMTKMTSMGRVSPLQPEDLSSEPYGKSERGGSALRQSEPSLSPKEWNEPNLARPTIEELKAFHDFFGDTPPSDALMFSRRIEQQAATASRTMINGLRKLVRMERAQTRGLSEGEAIGRVLDNLYENYQGSETRSEFVQKTLEQGRYGAPKEIPPRGAPRETGARELSTIRDVAPTTVRGAKQGTGEPLPEGVPIEPVEKLSQEERAFVEEEARKHHPPRFEVSPRTTLGKQVLETSVPKERYSMGKSKTTVPVEGEGEIPEGSDVLEEERKKEAAAEEKAQYPELFAERKMMSEAPDEPLSEGAEEFLTKPAREKQGRTKEGETGMQKALNKAESTKAQLDFWKNQGPAMLRRVEKLKEDTADAVSALNAYVKRKSSEQQLSATRDAVDTKYSIAADQVDKSIRLVTADKKMPQGNKQVLKAAPTVVQAGAYTIDYPVPDELKPTLLEKMKQDPIYRNIENMFSSNNPIDKAKGGQMLAKLKRETILQMVDDGEIDWHTGTVKYNKKAFDQLERFGTQLDLAEQRAKNIMESKGGGLQGMLDRRATRARLKAVGDMRDQLKYAEEHWNEPELQDTAAKMVVELEAQHRTERDMGMRVKRAENYLPGRYDEQWFDGDRIHFMEGPRILGRNFRKPATFSNYYEAIAAGNYLPFNMDGAALVSHRVRQGMRQVETRLWENSLKALKDPFSGKPMVTEPVHRPDGSYTGPSPEYELVDFGNKYMAVHKGSVDIIKALTGNSVIREVPATRRAMQLSQKLKHTILFLDTFHLGRLKAYDWSINGIGKGGYRGGLSILEYRPEDVPGAVSRGLVRPEDAAWADGKVDVYSPSGDRQVTRRQIGNLFLQRGLNAGRIADAIYKVERGPIGKYNKWLFDKMTRGLMLETAVKEFERMHTDHPKVDYRKLVDDIARDTNNYMGSIGRQGWIKNQTFQDIFRMFGLAPQWVEGLIKKETALPGRLTGLSYLSGRRNVPLLGTAGRGIARGLATMFVVTQAMNLITRRKPTWQNEEDGHKWDAWIPDATGKSEGFFMSPLSLFNEVTHDVIRLTGNKPTVYDAIHQIGENKLGPYGRAAMIFATGETPDHRKITSTGGMVKEMGKALIPVPISIGKVAQAGASAVGIGQPPAPGSVQRQAMASLGVKTEPAPTANSQIYKKADQFVKEVGLNKSTGWQQVQTDELGYSDLRRAAAAEDRKGFQEALEKLRENRTDGQIYKAMQLWNARPFTGSKAAEKYFLSDLTDKELDLYSRARVERQQTFSKFEDLLIDDLSKSPAPTK